MIADRWPVLQRCAVPGLGSVLMPALCYQAGWIPPWPSFAGGVLLLASIVGWIVGIAIVPGPTEKGRRKKATRLMVGAAIVVVLSLIGAIATWSLWVRHLPSHLENGKQEAGERVVIGYEFRPDVDSAARGVTDLLRAYGGQPDRIWTESSLTVTRLCVVVLFALLVLTAELLLTLGWIERRGRKTLQEGTS